MNIEAPAEGVHGRGAAAADVAHHSLLPQALHDDAIGQDGRLHGDAARGVPEPPACFQAQDEERGLDERNERA